MQLFEQLVRIRPISVISARKRIRPSFRPNHFILAKNRPISVISTDFKRDHRPNSAITDALKRKQEAWCWIIIGMFFVHMQGFNLSREAERSGLVTSMEKFWKQEREAKEISTALVAGKVRRSWKSRESRPPLTCYQGSDDQGQNHELQQPHKEFSWVSHVWNGDFVQFHGFQQDASEDTDENTRESDDEQKVVQKPCSKAGKGGLAHFRLEFKPSRLWNWRATGLINSLSARTAAVKEKI